MFLADAENILVGDWLEQPEIHIYNRQDGYSWPLLILPHPTEPNKNVNAISDTNNVDISADGVWVAYSSRADYLVPADENSVDDIFVTNRINRQTERISLDINGDEIGFPSYYPAISGDGRYVVFQSHSSFGIEDDTNGFSDIFRYDRQENSITRVSVSTEGQQALVHWVTNPDISDDGRYVVFETSDTNLVEGDDNICRAVGMGGQIYYFPCQDVLMRDTLNNTTTRISVDAAGQQVTGVSTSGSINANGRYVAFQSSADTLVANDNNSAIDIFVKNTISGAVERVSVASNGGEANDGSWNPKISGDGRFVTFDSRATNLVPDDDNGVIDIFVHDRLTKETKRVSVCACGTGGNDHSMHPSISGDGRVVAFTSSASNLVVGLGDTNNMRDVFVHIWQPQSGDNDGVPDSEEQGPDLTDPVYDGNGDGEADAAQDNVASLRTYDGTHYVTIVSPENTALQEVAAVENPSPDNSPPDIDFDFGFFEFEVTGMERGGELTVTVILPEGQTVNTFYMYSGTSEESSPHWYEFRYDGETGAQINGNVITLHFINGERGDGDVNGTNTTIEFLGGPGWGEGLPVSIKAMPWLLLLLDD